MADGESLLSALATNRAENFARRKQYAQDDLEARRANAEEALTSQRNALLSGQSGLGPDEVSIRVNEIDKTLAGIKAARGKTLDETAPSAFAKTGRFVGTLADQTLGGQVLSDVMTPSDSDRATFERNNMLAAAIPAVATLNPRGVATLPGRAARNVAKGVVGTAKRVSSVGGTGADALSAADRLSGAALKGTVRSGMTASVDEMKAAAPFIDAANGDFEAGMRAYKAAQTKAGKNVAIPSAAKAGPAASPAPSPEMAGNQHVPPRGAPAPAPAPTPAAPQPNVVSPSSSTLKTLLAGLTGASIGAGAASSLYDSADKAQSQISAEDAVLNQQSLGGLDALPKVAQQVATPQQQQAPVVAQPEQSQDNSLNNLIQQLLTSPQEGASVGSSPMISDTDIAQIKKLVDTIAPQQQVQAEPEKKQSVLVGILNALGKGLIAGGTGDPNAAFVQENQARQEKLAQEQLRLSKQQLSPQQQFANQLLAQVLGNRMGVSGQKEINSAQNSMAMQQQGRQIATQLLMLEREQQNALARNDRQYAQQLEIQKRDLAGRLEQIKASTTGQMQFLLNPEIQKMLTSMGGLGGGNNQPQVNQ